MIYKILRGGVLKVFYPAIMLAGAFVPSKKEAFQNIVIRLNNWVVTKENLSKISPPGRLLLLLPHCLQVDSCKIRLTHNVLNCERCGKCGIKDLIGVAERNKIDLYVATGGNLARRIVKDVGPDAIVAVACERDLSSGIADTYPLPVFGIINERPFGPCLNTKVDLKKIEQAINIIGKTTNLK